MTQSGTQDWVGAPAPLEALGSAGIGVGTEGAAAAKEDRAGASSGEAGEGVGVMGGSGVGTVGATAASPANEVPVKSGTSVTRGAAGVEAGGS